MSDDYKSAGVDIRSGEELIGRVKSIVKSTFDKNVLTEIGFFGAFYELDLKKYENPVLVSSVDGVGTKLKIAFDMNRHHTVGQDLVNHCVNDIAVGGAEPLYFMDYLAFGKLFPDKAEKIIEGFSIACRQNGVSLIGGETAEMPGLYAVDEYDMSGTIVGIVEKKNIINGENVKPGDLLIGFKSNGLHTNGYSLARKTLEKFNLSEQPDMLDQPLGDELLKVHKSYLPLIKKLKSEFDVKAFSHITGGGILGNTNRVIPDGVNLKIDWGSWEVPPIFRLIQKTGGIGDEEMRKVFNLGVGLIAIVSKTESEKLLQKAKSLGENGIVIGEII